MFKGILFALLVFVSFNLFSQPPCGAPPCGNGNGPGGNGNGNNPCLGANPPPSCGNNPVPISGTEFLLMAGVFFGVYRLKAKIKL